MARTPFPASLPALVLAAHAAVMPAQEVATPVVDPAVTLQQRFAGVAKTIYPAVVTVTAYERDPEADPDTTPAAAAAWIKDSFNNDYPGYRKIGIGSGFFVGDQGELLTCRHFLLKQNGELADIVDVQTDDLRHTITRVVATEPTLNLAVLELEVFDPTYKPYFTVTEWGNSAAARAGHWVFGVGNPSGPEQFFQAGTICSMPSRECYQDSLTATYLQSALTVHPECYGGPLLDLDGKVIGVLMPRSPVPGFTQLSPSYGIEFAMPSNIVIGIHKAIRTKKSFKSPWLGFSVMNRVELRRERGPEAFNALAKPRFGIYIENVFEPSAASAAVIRPGDFLVRFNGQVVHTPLVFQKLLYLAGIGGTAELEMFRDGATYTATLAIEERPVNAITR